MTLGWMTGKSPHPHTFNLTKNMARLLRAHVGLAKGNVVVKSTQRGLVVKRPGALS